MVTLTHHQSKHTLNCETHKIGTLKNIYLIWILQGISFIGIFYTSEGGIGSRILKCFQLMSFPNLFLVAGYLQFKYVSFGSYLCILMQI